MKVAKPELESRSWIWFKAFEKRFLVNVVRAQDFFKVWRRSLQSVEFWNFSWLWTALLMKICSLKIRFAIGQGTKEQLMSWVSSLVPEQYIAKGFPECFSDGILLCALVEKLVNGSCPRYDLLDPEQPLRNLKLALHLVERYIKIRPVLTAEEIQDCNLSERSLLLLIAHMKLMSEKNNLSINSLNTKKDFISPTTFVSEKCFARGMGLLLAVRGRKACFTILVDTIDDLDMVIEIRGPKNTGCRKRIASILAISKTDFQNIREKSVSEMQENNPTQEIPLEYTIVGQKITVHYTPLESGNHQMSIIWQGQHIMGSPYSISVDCSMEAPDIWPAAPKRGYSRLNRSYNQCDESVADTEKASLASCPEPIVTIKKKRVLRYIVKIDGNDVVIDGNKDLCEAINSIKRDQDNTPASRENCLEFQDQFESFFSGSDSEKFKIGSNTCTQFHSPSEQGIRYNTSCFASNKNTLIHIQGENDELVKTDEINLLKCSDSGLFMDCEEVFINENENSKTTMEIEEMNNFLPSNKNLECNPTNEFNEISKEERLNILYKEDNDNPSVPFTNRDTPKVKISFCDENIESDSLLKPNNFPSNFSNLDSKDLSPQSEDFFPVHKVAYEILHDDDDEDPFDPSKRRRSSFTELNESNYLDDDANDIELDNNESEAPDNSETDREIFPINIEEKYQKELKDYADIDINEHPRTNHSLFESDHSLSFFTETLVGTPPELAVLENYEHSEVAEENIWESKLSELNNENLKLFSEKSVEFEACKSNKKTKTGSLERSSSLTDFYDYDDSENIDPYSFHYTDLSKLEEEEFHMRAFSNSSDLVDKRRRVSWCDPLLPCILESSIEGLLDSDSENNANRNSEIGEDVQLAETTTSKQSNSQNTAVLSSSIDSESEKNDKISCAVCSSNEDIEVETETVVESNKLVNNETNNVSSNIFENKDNSQLHSVSGNTNKTTLSSVKIFSASPYINRNPDNKRSEVKFSPVMHSEKSSILTTTSSQPETQQPNNNKTQNSQGVSSTFILVHAKPAFVEECQNLIRESRSVQEINENISDKVLFPSDSCEIKSVQCNSVKRVIQIFQKEKEEPLDTWPTDVKKCNIPCCYRKNVDNCSTDEKDTRNELCQPKYCSDISVIENSCSSIKERVKLFESEPQVMKSHNISEKPSSSSISAKKQYWENITS